MAFSVEYGSACSLVWVYERLREGTELSSMDLTEHSLHVTHPLTRDHKSHNSDFIARLRVVSEMFFSFFSKLYQTKSRKKKKERKCSKQKKERNSSKHHRESKTLLACPYIKYKSFSHKFKL